MYSIYDHETSYIAASESMMHPIDFGWIGQDHEVLVTWP